MKTLQGIAHAKLNLTLDVIGIRKDGYHNLCMVMQEISLGDKIKVTVDTMTPWSVVDASGMTPCDDNNLMVKAAKLFLREAGIETTGMIFEIEKHIPVCAGLGGGSADAAVVLKLLQAYYHEPLTQKALFQVAEKVGSDVPFALFGGTALAQEKGQVLKSLPSMPRCYIVVCKPDFPISTPELFHAIDHENVDRRPNIDAMLEAINASDLRRIAEQTYNVFEPVVSRDHKEILEIETIMKSQQALCACMSGSGPTVFGIFSEKETAEKCLSILSDRFADTFLCSPV